MFFYILNVTMNNKSLLISDDLENAIKHAVIDASKTPNSKRAGRQFSYRGRIDEKTVQLGLSSEVATNATRCISSITRSLIRNYSKKEELIAASYSGSILNAEIVNMEEIGAEIIKLDDYEVVQNVFSVFYGRSKMNEQQKRKAKKAADEIKRIIMEYVSEIS